MNDAIGAWFQDITSEDVSFRLSQGCLELSNVELRRDALLSLGLPFLINSGRVAALRIEVDWEGTSLVPVKVVLEGVHISSSSPVAEDMEEVAQTLQKKFLSFLDTSLVLRSCSLSCGSSTLGHTNKAVQILRKCNVHVSDLRCDVSLGDLDLGFSVKDIHLKAASGPKSAQHARLSHMLIWEGRTSLLQVPDNLKLVELDAISIELTTTGAVEAESQSCHIRSTSARAMKLFESWKCAITELHALLASFGKDIAVEDQIQYLSLLDSFLAGDLTKENVC